MRSIDKLFDSEELRERAISLLGELNKEEKTQWLRHPCTQALLLSLQGDFLDIHDGWEGQSFIGATSDGTAQINAKALGQLEAIRDIAGFIEGVDYNDQNDGV